MKITIEDENATVTYDDHCDQIFMNGYIKAFYRLMLAHGSDKETLDKFINLNPKKLKGEKR